MCHMKLILGGEVKIMEWEPSPVPANARRRSIVVVVVAVLAGASWLALRAWVLEPQLVPGSASEYGADRGTIYYTFSVRNDGFAPLTLVGAGRSGSGLQLTSVESRFPVTLRHGEETSITVNYLVTDCGAVSEDAWPVPLTVRRPWGSQTVHLMLPVQDQIQWRGSDLPSLDVSRHGPVQWQRSQADMACALQRT